MKLACALVLAVFASGCDRARVETETHLKDAFVAPDSLHVIVLRSTERRRLVPGRALEYGPSKFEVLSIPTEGGRPRVLYSIVRRSYGNWGLEGLDGDSLIAVFGGGGGAPIEFHAIDLQGGGGRLGWLEARYARERARLPGHPPGSQREDFAYAMVRFDELYAWSPRTNRLLLLLSVPPRECAPRAADQMQAIRSEWEELDSLHRIRRFDISHREDDLHVEVATVVARPQSQARTYAVRLHMRLLDDMHAPGGAPGVDLVRETRTLGPEAETFAFDCPFDSIAINLRPNLPRVLRQSRAFSAHLEVLVEPDTSSLSPRLRRSASRTLDRQSRFTGVPLVRGLHLHD